MTPFRVVSTRDVRRLLRHPFRNLYHLYRCRFCRFGPPNVPRRLSFRLARPDDVVVILLDFWMFLVAPETVYYVRFISRLTRPVSSPTSPVRSMMSSFIPPHCLVRIPNPIQNHRREAAPLSSERATYLAGVDVYAKCSYEAINVRVRFGIENDEARMKKKIDGKTQERVSCSTHERQGNKFVNFAGTIQFGSCPAARTPGIGT